MGWRNESPRERVLSASCPLKYSSNAPYGNPVHMKLLALSIAVIALAFATCRRSEDVGNTNSGRRSADRIEWISNAKPKSCVNLNTSTAEELMRLPGIGDVMAKRIIDYRERHGRFRRPEEIIIIEGFSERKYRAIAGMVCVE